MTWDFPKIAHSLFFSKNNSVNQFALNPVLNFFDTYNFSGILDGDFIFDKNSNNKSSLYFNDLTLDQYYLGSLDLNINHNYKQNEFKFKSFLKYNSKLRLNTFGSFVYEKKQPKLDLTAKFEDFPINSLNIIGKKNINNI